MTGQKLGGVREIFALTSNNLSNLGTVKVVAVVWCYATIAPRGPEHAR